MVTKKQNRSQNTRKNLITVTKQIISEKGYEGLRVDEIVKAANVAKGTFFAHFKDKDSMVGLLIAKEIDLCLDHIETLSTPQNVDELILGLGPLISVMTTEKYVFDLILKNSGATSVEEIGPLATVSARQVLVFANWIEDGPFRHDLSNLLVSEGIQAFLIKALSLKFCALRKDENIQATLKTYLEGWLMPYAIA